MGLLDDPLLSILFCYLAPVAIGAWSNWTSSVCSATCGAGLIKKTRYCKGSWCNGKQPICQGRNKGYVRCWRAPCPGKMNCHHTQFCTDTDHQQKQRRSADISFILVLCSVSFYQSKSMCNINFCSFYISWVIFHYDVLQLSLFSYRPVE